MLFFKKKAKKVKKERRLTDEQEARQREVKKWTTILQNVTVYDGTGKGQIHIGR